MRKIVLLLINLLVIITLNISDSWAENQHKNNDDDKEPLHNVYFKIDQGFTTNRILDQKMSNLHYTGYGGILNFGRRVNREDYIAEWSFIRAQFNYSKPLHGATQVYNPSLGLRYIHLRNMDFLGVFDIHAGLQANIFTDMRIAPRLGNSFLFADIIGEVRPQADLSTSFHLLREWNMDFSLSATLIGYGLRIPEYGVIYHLGVDGGIAIQGYENHILTPSNFGHFSTGVFFNESIGDAANPNWFRIGYIWDYYSMRGNHDLNVNNAVHQLVLELYFRVN